MQYLLFFIIVLFVLLIGHMPVYFSFVKFFNINSPSAKLIVILSLFLLSASYILTSILIRFNQNKFFEIINYISAVWLGLLVSLLIFISLAWIVVLLAALAGKSLDLQLVGIAVISLSLIWTIYGCREANDLRLRTITVRIKNLPQAWAGKTAIQISDVHLGHINKQDFMKKIVAMAQKEKPDLVFITGDLFDGAGDHINLSAEPLKELQPPMGKYFITGNHETYLGLDQALAALNGTGVKVLRDENVNIQGVNLVGVDYPQRRENKNITRLAHLFSDTEPNIVLYHEPTNLQEFKQLGANLMLSGHTHRGQLWPFRYITDLVFKGYDYGQFSERDFNLYTSNGAGTWGPPLRTLNPPEIVKIIFE